MYNEIHFGAPSPSPQLFQADLTPSQLRFLIRLLPNDYVLEPLGKSQKKSTLHPPQPQIPKKALPEPVPFKKAPSTKSEFSVRLEAPKPESNTMISMDIPTQLKKSMSIEQPPPQIVQQAFPQQKPQQPQLPPSQTKITLQLPPQTTSTSPMQVEPQPQPKPQPLPQQQPKPQLPPSIPVQPVQTQQQQQPQVQPQPQPQPKPKPRLENQPPPVQARPEPKAMPVETPAKPQIQIQVPTQIKIQPPQDKVEKMEVIQPAKKEIVPPKIEIAKPKTEKMEIVLPKEILQPKTEKMEVILPKEVIPPKEEKAPPKTEKMEIVLPKEVLQPKTEKMEVVLPKIEAIPVPAKIERQPSSKSPTKSQVLAEPPAPKMERQPSSQDKLKQPKAEIQPPSQPKPKPEPKVEAPPKPKPQREEKEKVPSTQIQIKKPTMLPEKKAPVMESSFASTSSKLPFRPASEGMKKCYEVLQKLKKHMYASPFLQPVDEKALGITDYYLIIKHPMDLSTVEKKLKNEDYAYPTMFGADIRQIWRNAMIYNAEGSPIYKVTVEMSSYFERIFKDIEATYPPPPPVQEPYDIDKKIRRLCKQMTQFHHKGGKFTAVDSQSSKYSSLRDVPMTPIEKKALYVNVHSLPSAYMRGVWDIVNENIPAEKKNADFVNFDLETLPVEIIRKLERFVNYQINNMNKAELKLQKKESEMEIEGDKENGKTTEDETSESSFASESEEAADDY